MNKSSCELVKSAVDFAGPLRIPIEYLAQPDKSDIAGIGFEPTVWQWRQTDPGTEQCTDLFGCVRRRHDSGIGEVVQAPLASWDDLDGYRMPDIEHLKKQTAQQLQALPAGKFVLGDMGQFLTKIFEIRGFEQTLLDLGLHQQKIKDLAERLTDFAVKRTEMYTGLGGVHCISVYEDWGTQTALLMNPDQWRELFLDSYRRLFDYVHENGLYVYFHSCGAVGAIIPDLIEAGVNILNFDQPRLHGIALLGSKYAGKVTFCCSVDVQATLPTQDKGLIEAEAFELVKHLHRNGGFIAKASPLWAESDSEFDPGEYSREIFASISL
ncbi:MAG: uroporphyrinogen decarboxylase family protein [Planctomycetota bacterium]|nr:uroporphyrinogen decarboxylase family protein [Planctomycetota bacterium]